MGQPKDKEELTKTIFINLINLISQEKTDIVNNSKYIRYMFYHYRTESEDNRFIEWCDIGHEILILWQNMYQWINKNILNISLKDIINKIENSNLISDIEYWTLNYQQFRVKFTDITIEDVCCRIDKLYLYLQTLIMNYKKVNNLICENY